MGAKNRGPMPYPTTDYQVTSLKKYLGLICCSSGTLRREGGWK